MEGNAIARLVSPMKQLKIIKKDRKVLWALQFEALSNEVILHVFSYLKIVDLLNCGQVSKRFRAISSDDQYLWPKKLNLCYKSASCISSKITGEWMQIPDPFLLYLRRLLD
jgi:hypothetical protein